MLKKTSFLVLLGVLLAGVFAYGVGRLFVLRFEEGDVYPAYSSLRSDPLGVKGLYEALAQLPGVTVRRNFKPLPRLSHPEGPVTLVYAGVSRYAAWEPQELQGFDSLVLGGTRAVFAFRPYERSLLDLEVAREEAEAHERKKKARAEQDEKRRKKQGSKDKKGEDEGEEDDKPQLKRSTYLKFDEVARKLGLGFDFLPAVEKGKFQRRAIVKDRALPLEAEITWHSALYFKDLKPEWKVLYTCENEPVVVERSFGKGSIVLAADSYFLSNEAMREERRPQLLSWVFSGPSAVVFDEEHHGVKDDPGIASLARKYHLHGVVAGLLLIAGLFIWKSMVRFLPPHRAADEANDIVLGKEAGEGFVNLLWRTIPPAQILAVCTEEWRKSFTHKPRELAAVEELNAQEEAKPARERKPVEAYRAIARALSRR